MARTGTNENKNANSDYKRMGDTSFKAGQASVQNYNAGESELEAGQNIGANPYLNPQYLASVNRLQAGALNASNNAAKTDLMEQEKRSGGMNATSTQGTIRDLALQKMRLGDQLSAERFAGDYTKNLTWQQQLLANRMQPAQAEQGYYGTSTGGRNSALGNLTQLGIASYGPWMAAIQAAGQAAGGALGGGASKGCWIAEALYGENDGRTHLLRSWLNTEFQDRWYGRAVMRFYLKYGERIAAVAKRSHLLRAFLRPLFELALNMAREERAGAFGLEGC